MDTSDTETLPPKERLFQTAQKLFGDRDPADVSVRELAKEAHVNIAAINYHYRSKEGLYQAVIEHIIEIMETIFKQTKAEFDEDKLRLEKETFSAEETKTFYIRWYKRLIQTIARAILSRHLEGNSMHKLMIRLQMTGGHGFELLYERLNFFFLIMDECLEEITGKKGRKNILRMHAILGQIIIYVGTSHTVSRRLGVEKIGVEDVEEMIEVIVENSDAILNHLSTKGEKQ